MRVRYLLILVGMTSACAVRHVEPYSPKNRNLLDDDKRREYIDPTQPDEEEAAPGSLWSENRSAGLLVKDKRAASIGDVLQVRVEESADARRSNDVDVQRSSDNTAKISAFLGAAAQFDASAGAGSSNTFRGSGSTGRSEKFTAIVPALVKKVLNNGNLFVEGHRVILVNNEEHHFYISGVVRKFDIDQENSVKSSMLAEAQVEFTGRGLLTDNQQQGFFQRFFGWLWPF